MYVGVHPPRTLVVYAYFESDEVARANLAFFLKAAIGDAGSVGSDTEYVIVVNGGVVTVAIPESPHVRIVVRANMCYDSGAYAHVLNSLAPAELAAFDYFILINSSVRGPFLPLYLSTGGRKRMTWTSALTGLISKTVKWAGTTINCANSPHVQTPVVVTDAEGLRIVRDAGAFECPPDFPSAIRIWELGSSASILQAGYNIGSLMTRYANTDFRLPANAACNGNVNPTTEFSNDGTSLDPFEVMFIKVKSTIDLPTDALARRYADYAFGRDDITSTEYFSKRVQAIFREQLLVLETRAAACALTFDEEYYLARNKDLQIVPQGQLRQHWVESGFKERRLFRFVDKNGGTASATGDCAGLTASTIERIK